MTTQDVPQNDNEELAQLRQRLLDKIVLRESKRRRTSQLPWLLAALRASHAGHPTPAESHTVVQPTGSISV